jgi:3-hydroxybutyryl-CoA dehydrogenase
MSDIHTIAVIGSGTMGAGVAYVAALNGFDTRLFDLKMEQLLRAQKHIKGTFQKGVDKGKIDAAARQAALERLRFETDLKVALSQAHLVVEAVPESMELKCKVAAEVFGLAGPGALFATNTSSLSVTAIAAATPAPERVVGMHFFNPVHLMPLLELVRAEQTSDETLAAAAAVARTLGKETITVQDSPGFATSRLGLVLGLEAMRMLEAGVASAADIDRAMELGYRHPMGPLRLTDLVGLDVRLNIAEHLHKELGEQFRPPPILRRLVRAGRLGKKTGRGFYEWSGA